MKTIIDRWIIRLGWWWLNLQHRAGLRRGVNA